MLDGLFYFMQTYIYDTLASWKSSSATSLSSSFAPKISWNGYNYAHTYYIHDKSTYQVVFKLLDNFLSFS